MKRSDFRKALVIGGTAILAASAAFSCSSGSRTISTVGDDERGSGSLDSPAAAERHGCCTNHGGACGCGNGKVKCCDGTKSRNCGCE